MKVTGVNIDLTTISLEQSTQSHSCAIQTYRSMKKQAGNLRTTTCLSNLAHARSDHYGTEAER